MGRDLLPTEIIRQSGEDEQLVIQEAELAVTAGPDRGRKAGLRQGTVVVGTDPCCDLVLSDPAVSRRQFEIQTTPDGFRLRDGGSTNGTFIDRLRVTEAVLPPGGARIQVGRTRMKFAPRDERRSFPLSRRRRFGALLGESPAMRLCFALLERAAETSSTVLLEGESGTGKEVAAESLHRLSPRTDGPFEVVDCGAIAPSLIESELFGHEKGAFTGATATARGALERADGGTLFLDEVGELALDLQPRLLRFLEKREIRRLGGRETREVDVRVVAATNRRLEDMVRDGRFREDLFFRLAVIRVQLPALRHRRDDVPVIALELARRLRPDVDPRAWLDPGTLEVFAGHDWPGNVRELRNVIERLAALPEIGARALLGVRDDVAAEERPGEGTADAGESLAELPYHEAKERVLGDFERRYVARLLELEQGVVARAAGRAGVPRQTLFRLIRKHGLSGLRKG
jgi:DNA-binding NtrC family response regulator